MEQLRQIFETAIPDSSAGTLQYEQAAITPLRQRKLGDKRVGKFETEIGKSHRCAMVPYRLRLPLKRLYYGTFARGIVNPLDSGAKATADCAGYALVTDPLR